MYYLLWGHRTILIKHHILKHDIPELPNDMLLLDTLQRGVQWIGGAVDWGSII